MSDATNDYYTDSGIEWIRNLPASWPVKPMFAVVEEIVDKNVEGRVQNVLSLSYGKIIRREVNTNFGLLPESFDTYQVVQRGDIVLRLLDLQNDQVSLRVGLVPEEGIVTSAYVSVRPKAGFVPEYAAYLLHAYDVKKVFYSFGGGCRQSMGFEDLRRLPIPFPSPDEQRCIAAYLDKETAKIDRLTQMRRRQMALLKEQRATLIQQAVTRGLDPAVPLKDSGLPWLGEIPTHWELKPIKRIFTSLDGRRIPLSGADRQLMTKREYDYYGASGIIDRVDDYIFDEPLILLGEDGANLLNRNTPLAFIARGKYWVNNHAHILKPRRGRMEYLVHILEAVDYAPCVEGAAQPKLTLEKLMSVKIPEPPEDEQSEILRFIESESARYDTLSSLYARQLALLAEYRTALIHECVTGRRRVSPTACLAAESA